MKRICFITGTRADYGIMAPLMQRLQLCKDVELQVVATNMHLSPAFGLTVNEIIADGLPVSWKIHSLLSGDSPADTVKSMALVESGMAEALPVLKPDVIVLLGDRYEMLAAASAALIFRIPVVHLHGGETTEGAYDDAMRHAITQLSTYHLASTPQYVQRIVDMGASTENVHWIGSLAVDSILKEDFLPLAQLEDSLGWSTGGKFIVATFHPQTTLPGEERRQTEALLKGLDWAIARGWKVLFTMPNSDTGGSIVASAIRQWADARPSEVKAVASLGRKRYYSALHHAAAVVGNSSSGIIEAPSFGIPTLNIGDRQKGRVRALSVVDAAPDTASIERGLAEVLSDEFRAKARTVSNPYEKENSLEEALSIILETAGVSSSPNET